MAPDRYLKISLLATILSPILAAACLFLLQGGGSIDGGPPVSGFFWVFIALSGLAAISFAHSFLVSASVYVKQKSRLSSVSLALHTAAAIAVV